MSAEPSPQPGRRFAAVLCTAFAAVLVLGWLGPASAGPAGAGAASASPASAGAGASSVSGSPGAPMLAASARPVAPAGLPTGVADPPAGTNQLVTVLVSGAGATSGQLQAWRRSGSGWTSALGPVRVKVGTAGVGPTHEGLNRTPRGTFTLPSAFGRQANPGTKMPYRKVTSSDWWVSDPGSPAYNTYRHCAPGSCSFNEQDGENLGQAGASYDYAVVIGYNVSPVRAGAGSAFFVHVDAGARSAGCVETPRASVIALLRWLDPAQHPRITIGYS
ncbi:MAG TPA: L,D-transpeptidase family protein [Pseudonocardia sp.]|jgi:L,D-peptidoglycan transpeptidase YkuD (ErfK/YbiS/YcfS/YnhG family)